MIITPYTEQHAIKSVLFALEFASPLPPSVLKELASGPVHNQLKEKLPRIQELESLTFELPHPKQGLTPRPVKLQDVGGYAFDFAMPNGESEWMVNIQSGHCFVLCGKYNRWTPTWNKAKEFLSIVLPWILKHTSIGVIALQYQDEFTITENNPRKPLVELFNPDSTYVPKNITELTDQFHSHHGYFTHGEEPFPSKLLVNINIGLNDIDDYSVASIQTVHKMHLPSPMGGEVTALLDDNGDLNKCLEVLHRQNKGIVGNLLTDAVKARINFDGSKA